MRISVGENAFRPLITPDHKNRPRGIVPGVRVLKYARSVKTSAAPPTLASAKRAIIQKHQLAATHSHHGAFSGQNQNTSWLCEVM